MDLQHKGLRTYPDGRTVFQSVVVTVPERKDRRGFTISGDEAEVTKDNAQVRVNGHVLLKTSDGLTMKGGEATYDSTDGIIRIPGEVAFTKGATTGSSIGATYDNARDVLWMLERAVIDVPPGQGQAETHMRAGLAGFARAERYRGKRLLVGKEGIERAALDAEVGIRARQHPHLDARLQALPVCVTCAEAKEALEGPRWPSRLHALPYQPSQPIAYALRVIEECEQRWLMKHCAAHGLGVADQRRQREDPRAAGAKDRRRGQTEAREQRRRVIGLLLRRGRIPARGLGALPVAAAVVGDDRELVGQELRQPPKNAPTPAGTHQQEKRRPIAPQLVIELCLIRPLERHKSRRHDSVCAERAYPFSAAGTLTPHESRARFHSPARVRLRLEERPAEGNVRCSSCLNAQAVSRPEARRRRLREPHARRLCARAAGHRRGCPQARRSRSPAGSRACAAPAACCTGEARRTRVC